MDIQYFINILLRRKWLILATALAAAVAAFIFVDQKPEKFKSTATLSTGIMDVTGFDPAKESPWVQEYIIKMGFSNLVEFMTSQKNVAFLSYRLLVHDLTSDSTGVEPFVVPDQNEGLTYTPQELADLAALLQQKVLLREFNFAKASTERMYKDVVKTYGYDYQTLMEDHLIVERKGETDLLKVEFLSEHPDLSAFAANMFCKDVLENYRSTTTAVETESVTFLEDQVNQRRSKLNTLRSQLGNYKALRNVADLKSETDAYVTRRKELETNLGAYKSRIPSLKQSISQLNKYIADINKQIYSSATSKTLSSTAIDNMSAELERLNKQYYDGGMKDQTLKKRIDLITKNRETKIKELAEANSGKEENEILMERKENLTADRIKLEQELNEAEQGIKGIQDELVLLAPNTESFVVSQEEISRLESEIEIAQREYEIAYKQYSEEKLALDNTQLPVKIFEHAQVAEKSESKNRIIITAFSGTIGGILASVAVFLMAFLDYSVNTPFKFKRFTQLPLLGTVNRIRSKEIDYEQLFHTQGQDKRLNQFKESIRNLRYQVEHSDGHVFLVTSTKPGEGKTFSIIALAHALTLKKKRILLIDTNFKNNTITRMSQSNAKKNLANTRLIGDSNLSEDFESAKMNGYSSLDKVDIIGNKGSEQSPDEVFAGKSFESFLERVIQNYDYVFMESAALNNYTDAKELIDYADKVIAVFGANSDIKAVDKSSIEFLKSLGDKFLGAILNKVDIKNVN